MISMSQRRDCLERCRCRNVAGLDKVGSGRGEHSLAWCRAKPGMSVAKPGRASARLDQPDWGQARGLAGASRAWSGRRGSALI